ncbi:unnamed protein product, partial [Polarella glacialis]
RNAPVDFVGCEKLADPRASKADFEWQCLVAAMLSSLTRDQANAEAMACLRIHGNSAKNIAATPEAKLRKLIIKVGFPKVKAKSLRASAKMCLEQHGGRIPRTIEGLMALPGVGPKMAYLVMTTALNQQPGICVDTHVHRIANMLRWVRTKTPEETRVALESWLPKKEWPDINILLVGVGQMQQQAVQDLVEAGLALGSRRAPAALKLMKRMGVPLRRDRWPMLDAAAAKNPDLGKLLKRC